MGILIGVLAVLLVLAAAAGVAIVGRVKLRYGAIDNVEAEVARLRNEATRVARELGRANAELQRVEASLDDISFGLYKPHYRFDTPEQFRVELDRVRGAQRMMVRDGGAATGPIELVRLALRAFNGDADAAIARVSWNNATPMEDRIRAAFESINGIGGALGVAIAPGYRELKLAELRLEHELEERMSLLSERTARETREALQASA